MLAPADHRGDQTGRPGSSGGRSLCAPPPRTPIAAPQVLSVRCLLGSGFPDGALLSHSRTPSEG